jgi:tyrosyl-tRNA synthetase
MPLLEGLNGVDKMSKSLGNYVAVDEAPQDMFGKLMSISDDLMWRYLELLSFESTATIAGWRTEVGAGLNPREVKVRLAKEIVARFHGRAAAAKAETDFNARFRERADPRPEDMEVRNVSLPKHGIAVPNLLKESGLTVSTTAAVQLIVQGGVTINGEKISDRTQKFDKEEILTVKVGKLKYRRVKLTRDA